MIYYFILFFSTIAFCYLVYRFVDWEEIPLNIDPQNIPNVKWPFINIQDENGENLNILCLRGPLEDTKDIKFFKQCLNKGIQFVGCSSYTSFPQPCLNPHGTCHETMEFEGKPYYHSDYVIGWLHPFRNPRNYIPTKLPTMLLSESDFADTMNLTPEYDSIVYDFLVYCPSDDECDKGWHHHNKNWPLCKSLVETLANHFNQKGIVIGHETCPLDIHDTSRVVRTDFLQYWDFIQKMKQSRYVLIPSFEDASPRTITEALTLDKPVLMNRSILGGWKYIHDQTGMFIDEDDQMEVIPKFLERIGSMTPRKYFFKHYGVEKSGRKLKHFLRSIKSDLRDCTLAVFPVS